MYVHVPFCARRCSYCDFAIAVRRETPAAEFAECVGNELAMRFPDTAVWPVDTLYFGGGTPSRLGAAGVAALIGRLRERFELTPDAEVTLEANPDDVDAESVAVWREAGVNRLSIGSQSFDDDVLRWMHRTHDARAIRRAVEAARAGGIENLSLDLIFALPVSVRRSWERDVAEALALEPEHLSLYGLTIEPHTPLGRWHSRGAVDESPEERYEAEFLHAHSAASAAGLEHYEISNFGRPGKHSRHNSSYWAGAPYVGLGPSAHEFDGAVRRWNEPAYARWLELVRGEQDPVAGSETLNDENRRAEAVYLGLRTCAGLSLADAELARVEPWVRSGWGDVVDGNRLVLTPLGWLRLDALAADLTLVRSRY